MMDQFQIYRNHLLGKGAFGEIYLALDKINNKVCAVKTEKKFNTLLKEKRNLDIIHSSSCTNLIIRYLYYEPGYMFMPLYGPDLKIIFFDNNRKIQMETMKIYIPQMVKAVQYCHNNGMVHRDIKPSNFMTHFNYRNNRLVLTDFGLSKKVIVNDQHIPYRSDIKREGTLRFMSKYSHKRIEISFRDDIYSLIYTIIYLLSGSLPWPVTKVTNRDESNRLNYTLYKQKNKIKPEKLVAKVRNDQYRKSVLATIKYIDEVDFGDFICYDQIMPMVD
jgi:serine/threonine protein kinase